MIHIPEICRSNRFLSIIKEKETIRRFFLPLSCEMLILTLSYLNIWLVSGEFILRCFITQCELALGNTDNAMWANFLTKLDGTPPRL